jgi:hypothetical protein
MSFPTTSVLDTFNRTDENPLANGTWSGPLIVADNQLQVLSNHVTHAGTSYWTASFGPDCEGYCELVTRSVSADYMAIWLRAINPNTANLSGYRIVFFMYDPGDFVRIYRIDNGAATQLGSDISIVPNLVSGDAMGVDIVGSTITAYKRVSGVWSSLGTQVDGTYAAAGNIALMASANVWVGDNFGGGTVVTGALPPVPASRMVGVAFYQG